MSNIIKAIINFVENPVTEITSFYQSTNRANNQGDALEEYVKDLFANTVLERDEQVRNRNISNVFSYLGNQNNPPDSILKAGDAIEVKKIQSSGSSLVLNSSYPKAKLYANSTMITEACRECEEWVEKDIIYIVGVVNRNKLSHLVMLYGVDYAANEEVYTRIKDTITEGVNSISDVEFSETRELGRVNKVDPLGITYLRIRGMWGIENPMKVFDYIYKPKNNEVDLMVLINKEKYQTLNHTEELEGLVNEVEDLEIEDVEIKNPNNPAQLREAKLIKYSK